MLNAVKRYFKFFNIPGLILILIFFSTLIYQTGEKYNIEEKIILTIIIMTIVMLANPEPLLNIKWVITGKERYIPGNKIVKREKYLKELKCAKTKPLFVSAYGNYYYQEDNFDKSSYIEVNKKEEKNV